MRRGHKTALRVLGFLAAGLAVLLALVVGAGFLLGYTDWGRARLLAALLPTVQEQLAGRLRVGRLGGGLLDMLVLHDVVLDDPEGQEAVRVARLGLDYDLLSLLRRRIHIQSAEAQGLVLRARPLRDGRLNLLALKKPSTEPTPELRYALIVDRLRIAGTARWELPAGAVGGGPLGPIERVAGDLELDGALRLDRGVLEGSLQQLAVRVQEPLVATLSGRGGVRLAAGRLQIVDAALGLRTTAPELVRLVPAAQPLEPRGAVSVDLTARGPLDALHAELAAHLPRGELGAQADVDVLAAAPVWRAQVAAREIDPAALSARLPPAQLALVASGQGTGATGRIQLSHLQAELAGARLTAQGQLGLDGSADLRAQASVPSLVALQPPVQSLLSLRGETEPLPLSSLAGAIEASAHVVRTAEQLRLDADLTGSGLRGFGGAAAQGQVIARGARPCGGVGGLRARAPGERGEGEEQRAAGRHHPRGLLGRGRAGWAQGRTGYKVSFLLRWEQPPATLRAMLDVFEEVARLRRERQPCALCTVVRTAGSTPRKSAARMLVSATEQVGTIGGGRVEKEVVDAARALLADPDTAEPRLYRYHLTRQLGMCCGGEMEVFVEPMCPAPTLIVCGGGHVAKALVPLARPLGFCPIVVEDLEELGNRERFPDAEVWGIDVGAPLREREHRHDQQARGRQADADRRVLGFAADAQ